MIKCVVLTKYSSTKKYRLEEYFLGRDDNGQSEWHFQNFHHSFDKLDHPLMNSAVPIRYLLSHTHDPLSVPLGHMVPMVNEFNLEEYEKALSQMDEAARFLKEVMR